MKFNNMLINKENRKKINLGYRCDDKILYLVILSLFMIILIISNVDALGITPGRTTVDYEAGLEKEIEFSIINNEHKNMKVTLFSMMQDDLDGSITLFEDHLEFLPSEERKTLKYKVKLPEELSPGLHVGEIVAVEIPGASDGETFIGATIAVVSQLHIYVPCSGKCIEAELNVLDAEQNGTATFIVPVISRGMLGIGEVRAMIDIYKLDEKIATIETDYSSLEPGKRTELSAKWEVNVPSGDYLAKVTVFFDGENERFEKLFTVGTKTLSIESILVKDFRLGEIAKLQILVENKWSQELKSVFANLLVYNKQEQVMADVKSATEDIPALTKKELIAYWDTVGVEEGEYNGKLMVRYGEKSTDKNLILRVSEDSLDITGVGYAIRPGGKGINITSILLVLVIILLIVNLAWFVFFRRFMRKKQEKGRVIRA